MSLKNYRTFMKSLAKALCAREKTRRELEAAHKANLERLAAKLEEELRSGLRSLADDEERRYVCVETGDYDLTEDLRQLLTEKYGWPMAKLEVVHRTHSNGYQLNVYLEEDAPTPSNQD